MRLKKEKQQDSVTFGFATEKYISTIFKAMQRKMQHKIKRTPI